MFHAFCIDTQSYQLDGDTIATYATGDLASEACKALRESTGARWQPRKAAQSTDWRAREESMIESGARVAVDFAPLIPIQDHYAHLSAVPGKLAYTKDAANGALDIQTRVTPGTYLERFYPALAPDARAAMAQAFVRKHFPSPLQFATTPDEIEHVYTQFDPEHSQVAGSCMRYSVNSLQSAIHPVRIYGAGDLAIAYLAQNGLTTHRALCWPARKIYSRVYGEDAALHDALKKAGFVKSAYYGNNGPTFAGAKLLQVIDDDGRITMPYFDEPILFAQEGDCYVMALTGRDASGTTGFAPSRQNEDEAYDYCCERCENTCEETSSVYINRRDTESWCDNCVDDHTFVCSVAGDYYSDDVGSYETATGETISQYAYAGRYATCDYSEEIYPSNAFTEVLCDVGPNKSCADANLSKYAWLCGETDNWYCNSVETTLAVNALGEQVRVALSHATDSYIYCDIFRTYVDSDYYDSPECGERKAAESGKLFMLPSVDQLSLALA